MHHHHQRMAAFGTDKELSDLLDFSAVGNGLSLSPFASGCFHIGPVQGVVAHT
uniref:Uncharacterized protein n=1 Tax=Periophthalmus magnuspinnatus TaxID=409849 RepID=A0A3B3ZJ23_9GOBI